MTFVGDGVQVVSVEERGEVEVSRQLLPVTQRESDVPSQRQVHLSDEVCVCVCVCVCACVRT